MKKSSLTTAVVAGIVGAAGLVSVSNAVNINPDGLGQALIYPYYTVNKGNTTLISVVNTTNQTKAVKIRFMEGRDSQEVLDFNLYMSPFDVWTANVTGGAEGDSPAAAPAARVSTTDTSCTVPALPAGGEPFRNFQYAVGAEKTNGPFALSRTREGHLEVIEMGVLDPAGTLARAAKHGSNGIPANCAGIVAAWDIGGGTWTDTNGVAQVGPPQGGLFGGAEIVNPGNGQNISYNADAIEGFYVSTAVSSLLHTNPGSLFPSLAQAQSDDGGDAEAIVFSSGTLFQFPFTGTGAGLRAVSAIFMHNEIYNEYSTEVSAAVTSESEWVITFPTKRLHISEAQPLRLPFRSSYDRSAGGACEPIAITFWDREERTTTASGTGFSPPAPGQASPSLCYEAQILTFNQDNIGDYLEGGSRSAIFGSYYARNIDTSTFQNGWARLRLGDQSATSGTQNFLPLATPSATPVLTDALVGLPVTGFWASNFVGGASSGLLANFSLTHKHRADRVIAEVTVSTQAGNPIWRPATVPAGAQ